MKKIIIGSSALLLFLLLGSFIVWRWMVMAREERLALLEISRMIQASIPEKLNLYWQDKITWYPSAKSDPALAVMPRNRKKRFDAIYALYQGHQARMVLIVTPAGGFLNNEPIDQRQNPQTLIPRRLTSQEQADLQILIALLQDWRASQTDTQAPRYSWTQMIIDTARQIQTAQSSK